MKCKNYIENSENTLVYCSNLKNKANHEGNCQIELCLNKNQAEIIFSVDGKDILIISGNGDIYREEKLIGHDHEILVGLKKWLRLSGMLEEKGIYMKDRELIKHAAIKTKNGTTVAGRSHLNCITSCDPMIISTKDEDQGFLTSKGRFVDRELAAKIAFRANQIDHEAKYLTSDDLQSEECNGKFYYDPNVGYKLKDELQE